MEKAAVEMRDIIKEMGHHMPERFLWNHVFLAANMAIPAMNDGTAVQAIILLTLRDMGHDKFFLKISTKSTTHPFFYVTEHFE